MCASSHVSKCACHVQVYVHLRACLCRSVSINDCIFVYMYVHLYVLRCICVFICLLICMFVRVQACMYKN